MMKLQNMLMMHHLIFRKLGVHIQNRKGSYNEWFTKQFVESGSSYSVGISDPLYRCDVNFTDVNKIIHGVFSFTPEEKSLYCQCY